MGRKPIIFQPLGHTFDQSLAIIANANRPDELSFTARPFLKWVGGKRSILPELIQRLPAEYGK